MCRHIVALGELFCLGRERMALTCWQAEWPLSSWFSSPREWGGEDVEWRIGRMEFLLYNNFLPTCSEHRQPDWTERNLTLPT